MKGYSLFELRFDLLAMVGLLVGLACSSPASAQEAPDLVWEVAGGAGSVSAVAFSPDGQQVASGAGSQNGTAKIWDAANGTALATFPGQANGVYAVDFSAAGMLAVGGLVLSQGYPVPSGVTDVWRLADETILHSFAGGYAAFSADGTRLATGGLGINRQILVHELPAGTRVAGISTNDITVATPRLGSSSRSQFGEPIHGFTNLNEGVGSILESLIRASSIMTSDWICSDQPLGKRSRICAGTARMKTSGRERTGGYGKSLIQSKLTVNRHNPKNR